MKDFFKSELQTLKAKTGLNQYETFSNMPDAAKQISILLDSMVLVCNEFPYIPDTDKKKIIQKMIIQDQEFTALNSRAVWKWLNMHKDSYWAKEQEIEHFEQPVGPLSPETEKLIKDFQDNLARQMEAEKRNRITSGKRLREEMDKIILEDAERVEGKKTAKFQTNEIEAEKKALHLQYLKENYDPITGKKLDCWIEESDWIAQQL